MRQRRHHARERPGLGRLQRRSHERLHGRGPDELLRLRDRLQPRVPELPRRALPMVTQ